MPHVTIIGAGIPGVTSAYMLMKRGYDVTVVDRERYAAMETSYANGSQLSACNAEVWNKTATIVQGLRWMLRSDAPLLMNPMPSWHKYSWMIEFIAAIPKYRTNTMETVRLAMETRKHLFRIAEEEGIDCDLTHKGIMHVYRDRASFEAAKKINEMFVEAGLDRHAVTPDEMRSIEPALSGDLYGGLFTPSDSTGDAHKFSRGLAEVCRQRGVRFVHDAHVETIVRDGTKYRVQYRPIGKEQQSAHVLVSDAVAICAGVASRAFACSLGDRINVYPVKGYSITVELNDQDSRDAAPRVGLLDSSTEIVASRLGEDRYRVAGTAEFNGFNRDIRADRIKPLVDWVRWLFPNVNTERAIPWAGLRPMTPDMMPHVGPGKQPGVFYNTGHGNHGWTLSAVTAELLAEAVAKQVPA